MSTLLRGPLHGGGPKAKAIFVDDGRIAWIGAGAPPGRAKVEIAVEDDEMIAPGFVDLQVNGAGGVEATDAQAISAISELLPRFGVTAYLPTLISRPLREARSFVDAVAAATPLGARILGSHLEGPFINPDFRGAHDEAAIVAPMPEHVERILAAPPRMITLAPEVAGGLAAVERFRAAGIIVAAGHSGADYECGLHAIDAGVRFGTHLYNAMRDVHHRRPGLSGALLLDARVTVGMIADGEHLHDATVAQAVRLKTPARVALTTDQTAAAGSPAGRYRLGGRAVISDGQAVRLEDGTLAGSVATMDELVRRVAGLPGIGWEAAITMASRTPADVLGEHRLGRLEEGSAADLVILDRDRRVRLTMVAGRVTFER